jgi:hypothetical protein
MEKPFALVYLEELEVIDHLMSQQQEREEWPPEDLDEDWVREQIKISQELRSKRS